MSEDKKLSQRLTEILLELDETQRKDLYAQMEGFDPLMRTLWPRSRINESLAMTDEIKNFMIKYASYLMKIGK